LPSPRLDTNHEGFEVKTPIVALAAVALISAAGCSKNNETKTTDTTTMRTADTANGEVKTTTDTVVKTTATATDTLKGKAADTTMAMDTTKGTAAKKGTKRRPMSKKGY
jgi:hypothetical protein